VTLARTRRRDMPTRRRDGRDDVVAHVIHTQTSTRYDTIHLSILWTARDQVCDVIHR